MVDNKRLDQLIVGVVGLGYVGLPLAVEFGKIRRVIGYDINRKRIEELRSGSDRTLETTVEKLKQAAMLSFTSSIADLKYCNCFIVTVPTPINKFNKPDLTPLTAACKKIGEILKKGDIVIYESTVYPGVTEDVCVPILERESGLTFNTDFFCGYSPERINPGDREHGITAVVKITSGSTSSTAMLVDELYKQIVTAGTYKAESIRVAEAAKVIENTQRDLNIALINELSVIFNKIDVDTEAVLKAAGTKWNFLPFKPGLVGGHCIGVDPYYLTHKAEEIGYFPQVILAGRRMNDGMGRYVASVLVNKMEEQGIKLRGSRILMMGFTFKENCPDPRNTRVVDICESLIASGCNVDIYDPWLDSADLEGFSNIIPISYPSEGCYDATVISVAHKQFFEMGSARIRGFGKPNQVLYDLKHVLTADESDIRL